jgi:hypothetical protein
LDTLRADNARLRRLLQLSEEQARAAASDQAPLTGAPASPVAMGSSSADKVACRKDSGARRLTAPGAADLLNTIARTGTVLGLFSPNCRINH